MVSFSSSVLRISDRFLRMYSSWSLVISLARQAFLRPLCPSIFRSSAIDHLFYTFEGTSMNRAGAIFYNGFFMGLHISSKFHNGLIKVRRIRFSHQSGGFLFENNMMFGLIDRWINSKESSQNTFNISIHHSMGVSKCNNGNSC